MAIVTAVLRAPSDYVLITPPGVGEALAFQFRDGALIQVDVSSSSSSQHYIETGEWLTPAEAAEYATN